MIVKNHNDLYTDLFKEAYDLLGLTDNPEGRFTSLAEYYSHMADLFATGKYKYVLLPLDEDEESFYIDLNTRTINVPQSFSKCASVQNDQLAETIVFEVDRYFDFMDLAMTDIHVQWTIPENKKDGIEQYEGATKIEMIDLESKPGKIKFAWPLNDSITSMAGSVNFSVRFSIVDHDNLDKVYYNLNTTSSTIIIKPALQKDLDRSKIENPNQLFQKAVINSIYAGEGIIPPSDPAFDIEPGSLITTEEGTEIVNGIKIASLNDKDTVTLYAQAIVHDAGAISYVWYHKAEDGKVYSCERFPKSFNEDGTVKEYGTFGTVKDAFLECKPQPTERVKNERYYYEESEGVYELYTDNVFPASKTLFERYTSFTVPNDVVITGVYQAGAFNTVMADGKTITTPNVRCSDECLIPGPSTIVFKENGNLVNGIILNDDKQANLLIQLDEDPYGSNIEFKWYKNQSNDDAKLGTIVSQEKYNYIATEPGWYQAEVISTLNREEKTQFSNVCRVTEFPLPPIVTPVTPKEEYTGNITDDEPPVFTVKAEINNYKYSLCDSEDIRENPDKQYFYKIGEQYAPYRDKAINAEIPLYDRVKSETLNEKLLSDKLEYVWQIRQSDTDKFITIAENCKGVSGLHTNSITFNNDFQFNKGVTSATIRCLVVNHLNGQKAVFDHSAYLAENKENVISLDTVDSNLGKFEAALPYVMPDKTDWFRFTLVQQ